MEFLFFGKGWRDRSLSLHLVASAIGTIFPQEIYIPSQFRASEYYQQEYGYAREAVLYTWIS